MTDAKADRERLYWDDAYVESGQAYETWLRTNVLSQFYYSHQHFVQLVESLPSQRILSLGGGFDRFAVSLAQNGSFVTTVDLSPAASEKTRQLAEHLGVQERLTVCCQSSETLTSSAEYDLVICKRSLHHMNLPAVLEVIARALRPGGFLVAEEPVCLSRTLRWVHKNLPFHTTPVTEDEREFSEEDLALFRLMFADVQIDYFELLSRESVGYLLYQCGLQRLIRPIGSLDYKLAKRFDALRSLCSWAVIRGSKSNV
jgi:SAM-dependent methyltransferase